VKTSTFDQRGRFDERGLAATGREPRWDQNDPLVRRDAPTGANVRHAPPAHPFRLKLGEIHALTNDSEPLGRRGEERLCAPGGELGRCDDRVAFGDGRLEAGSRSRAAAIGRKRGDKRTLHFAAGLDR
jgi:hypothetical protein